MTYNNPARRTGKRPAKSDRAGAGETFIGVRTRARVAPFAAIGA